MKISTASEEVESEVERERSGEEGTHRESLCVADDDEELLGARRGDVEALGLVDEASVLRSVDREPAQLLRADGRDDDDAAVAEGQHQVLLDHERRRADRERRTYFSAP